MRAEQGSYTCSIIPRERIDNVKVMHRATPVVRARVKAKTIYQSGFVGQLERRWQGIGVVASVKTIVRVRVRVFNEKNPSQKKEETSYKGVVHVVTLPILHVCMPKLAVFRGRFSRTDRQKI